MGWLYKQGIDGLRKPEKVVDTFIPGSVSYIYRFFFLCSASPEQQHLYKCEPANNIHHIASNGLLPIPNHRASRGLPCLSQEDPRVGILPCQLRP